MKKDTSNLKNNYRNGSTARCPQRSERGGSVHQTTPPQIPDKTHRLHGELSGVGCWITRFSSPNKGR